MPDIGQLPIILRREVEALMAAPLIKAYIEELGRDKALDKAGQVIMALARESGRKLAASAGGKTLAHFQRVFSLFAQEGALEMETVAASEKSFIINVTRCRYAEMYREHGLADFGVLLSCNRDYGLLEGFNPKIRLTRTKTIMEGAELCDFCFIEED
ncbi:MAG: L-2-amino-thiazoline-4-carboxylic acid hydrolase [Thermodesulfobacteriota bacterium]